MSRVSYRVRSGSRPPGGGLTGYPLDALHEEVAYLAYHFNWPLQKILELEHADRQRWVEEVARINRRMNESRG